MKSKKQPAQVALYGMDSRAYKMMEKYLQGPCKGVAIVVDSADAQVDIIDADFIKARDILEERQSKTPERPIVLLSLQPLSIEGTFYVKKPVKSEDLIRILREIYSGFNKQKRSKNNFTNDLPKEDVIVSKLIVEKEALKKKKLDIKEKKKISKHKTAVDLTEDVFSSYMGHVEGLDLSDTEQVLLASFNAKNYFLNYVQSALKVAKNKKKVLQLDLKWKPLIIFPESNEIWLDSDDKQLKSFSGIVMKKWSGNRATLRAVDHHKIGCHDKMEGFYDTSAFLWKVALWTSKGRYPDSIDIHTPVFLTQWPNFTRLLITPHSLQIAALLTDEPRLLMDVIKTLKVKPEYVFVFISAAQAIGIVGQVKRQSDEIVAPKKVKKSKAKSLLGRILRKLRIKE